MSDYFTYGKQIITELKRNGYDAYFVGGFVRDRLLNIQSKDIDITTNASPNQVISLFKRVKETGKKYGTVTILLDQFKYEVTTFRSDGAYKDNRRPDEVFYSDNIEDDVARRDFTINALVMDENEQIKDFYNGLDDLEKRLIRTINNPLERFDEDALRMLRAFRFVSKLDFDIEENTFNAISQLKENIPTISIERIMGELDKIFRGPYRNKAIKLMIQSGVSSVLFGIEEGLKYVSTLEEELYPIEVFILCFILSEYRDEWQFSNVNKRLIKQIMVLHEVTKEDEFNKFIVYVNKLDSCILANKVNVLLGYKDQEALIRDIEKNLPIKDVCDLTFKGQDILWLTELRKKSWIGEIVDDLKYNVIMGYLPNDYEVLKEYALKKVEELKAKKEKENE